MQLLIVTGLSGAGKSTALHALEDMGFYCVDNLPPSLIPQMAALCEDRGGISRVALGVDVRGGIFFEDVDSALRALDEHSVDYEIIFFEASSEELIRRYKETRRSHPMGGEDLLEENIEKERGILRRMRDRAARVVDTTAMLSRQMREMLLRLYGEGDYEKALQISLVSFGFKRGLPQEADLILDVRFLPNPFYEPALRPLTGKDERVSSYVFSFPEAGVFLNKATELISFLIPYYIREGKPRLIVGVGCTGGQHRSVALAEALARALRGCGFSAAATHREFPE
ncbi:MAG: RNase adapter RapZ [Christensenellaceae bacterium]|jgi:UPF0042 nucleotide-binding protein|nr:RNase adapter RapZ [Christensenellaceae bacterium]